MSSRQKIAHAKQDENGQWHEPHLLMDHLLSVAELVEEASIKFNSGAWGELAGRWHDLGKFRPKFQKYIREKSGYERENAHVEDAVGRVTHSTAGATHAINTLGDGFGHIIAYLIAGHHAGLPDWIGGQGSLSYRLNDGEEEYTESVGEVTSPNLLTADMPEMPEFIRDQHQIALWMRLLFSCLVDADFLDTEEYMSPSKAKDRKCSVSIADLTKQFFNAMEKLQKDAHETPLNLIRNQIYEQCLSSSELKPGIYSLTVPTGGGKTLSSLAFALRHAQIHRKERIIYAIPFTSIIEQNAKVFTNILGEESVLEHHSSLDVDASKESGRSRLAAENWDFPLIVTTNVQLFESLFASRTSRCRKLHNLINSVIVLDEAQQLPRDFHAPITQVMQQLSDHFGVTWLLCTATQPVLGEQRDAFGRVQLSGLKNVQEIITDPVALSNELKRVNVIMPSPDDPLLEWQQVGALIGEEDCVLAIVNTRNNARELFLSLPNDGNNLHLSANMCAEHRTEVLKEIRIRLKQRKDGDTRPLRVVSTQLIEAGVDVDFPVVYRAMAGLDSIAQAAGRCNREGLMKEKGKVIVFRSTSMAPPGFLRQGEQTTLSLLKGGLLDDPLSPDSMTRYFSELNRQGSRDKYDICGLLKAEQTRDVPLGISFRAAAEKFKLIDNAGIAIVVPFSLVSGEESPIYMWLNMLEKDPSAKWIYRKLQRYTVTVPESFARQLDSANVLESLAGQFVVKEAYYHDVWGVQPPDTLLTVEQTVF